MLVNFFYTWSNKKERVKILSGNIKIPKFVGSFAKIFFPSREKASRHERTE